MEKKNFVEQFEMGIEEEFATEVRVGVRMPNLSSLEYIHNPEENFVEKLEYYKNAYNENMELNSFNEIQIETIEFFHCEGGFWSDIRDFD